ncbi:hypothetical protein [Aquibacillus saliphilus]|uniref:hypothetical protein n=1 Tax=Aquibacillus saliphilus TaxID=1909422 RepID=UPI001CF03C2C
MNLELIDSSSTPHPGYGAGSGRIIREEFKCPCGKGVVIYEKDDIPGFRESDVSCDCKDCDEKYKIIRGMASEK